MEMSRLDDCANAALVIRLVREALQTVVLWNPAIADLDTVPDTSWPCSQALLSLCQTVFVPSVLVELL